MKLYEQNTLLENKDGFKLTTISCEKHINLKAEGNNKVHKSMTEIRKTIEKINGIKSYLRRSIKLMNF